MAGFQVIIYGRFWVITEGLFEYIWVSIFRSQISALDMLNAKSPPISKIEELKLYYDSAVSLNPHFYTGYPFTSWLGYIKYWLLVGDRGGDSVYLTVRGREFLKYMAASGKSATTKNN